MGSNVFEGSSAGSVVGSTIHGYPRQGRDRELKRAIEGYWRGRSSRAEMVETAGMVRRQRLEAMRGLDEVPVGDFSLYDHVLDTAWMFGAVPRRFAAVTSDDAEDDLDTYFAMARGTGEVSPLEMTKWFDTNYHYLVPELHEDMVWSLRAVRLLDQVREAIDAGLTPRPVVLGPVTFLSLSKASDSAGPDFQPMDLLDGLLDRYAELLTALQVVGAGWVQLDEPILSTDVDEATIAAIENAYAVLARVPVRPKLLLAQYFGDLGDRADRVVALPVEGFAFDLAGDARATLDLLAGHDLTGRRLVAGVVEGRNVWRNDLEASLVSVRRAEAAGAQVDVAASCSLLHVPIDVDRETAIDPDVRGWLAFADQKIVEVITIASGASGGTVDREITAARAVLDARRVSRITRNSEVRTRVHAITADDLSRRSHYGERTRRQRDHLPLPVLPTTTIGSFPQTSEIRKARAAHIRGTLDDVGYLTAMRAEIEAVVRAQERLGLDVVVHGEPERNDMVQYFADQLTGVISTEHGWVQSYGTRCVRPPIVAGDITRPAPMTVEWSRYAQTLTDRPVKGMLTGPVTMLAWSFVRDDQPVGDTARQMALALRAEVADLEDAGISVIQVDEPALRETLPLRRADRPEYLQWAVDAFRLTTAGVDDATQIHTHMCYAEFGDITRAIDEMDADVISLEAARSRMEIVKDLALAGYPREVGPGVWDIHSPRVPSIEEITVHLRAAIAHLPADRVWVNPDCGLKTRGWPEVTATLKNLVTATALVRADITP